MCLTVDCLIEQYGHGDGRQHFLVLVVVMCETYGGGEARCDGLELQHIRGLFDLCLILVQGFDRIAILVNSTFSQVVPLFC